MIRVIEDGPEVEDIKPGSNKEVDRWYRERKRIASCTKEELIKW